MIPRSSAERRAWLERLYARYNTRAEAAGDPVHVLYRYADPADREVAGLVAAALAYGRVAQIVEHTGRALAPLGPRPAVLLATAGEPALRRACEGFRHRWTDGDDLCALLNAVRRARRARGSLQAWFEGLPAAPAAARDGLSRLVRALRARGGPPKSSALLPDPADGSACKRLLLYLRWMTRRDEVDPGGWTALAPAALAVPLDVHAFRTARAMGFTRRRRADGKAAVEITRRFARLRPDDPVRYDFALTRWSMAGRPPLHREPGVRPDE